MFFLAQRRVCWQVCMDRTSHMFCREKIAKCFMMAWFLKERANALDTNAPKSWGELQLASSLGNRHGFPG